MPPAPRCRSDHGRDNKYEQRSMSEQRLPADDLITRVRAAARQEQFLDVVRRFLGAGDVPS